MSQYKTNPFSIVITVIVTAVVVAGGMILANNRYRFLDTATPKTPVETTTKTPTNETTGPATYTDGVLGFSIEVPAGYHAYRTDGEMVYVVMDATAEAETPPPEMVIRRETGSVAIEAAPGKGITKTEDVIINGLSGKKTTVTYSLGNGDVLCSEPIYRLQKGNAVFELHLWECLDSAIFEQVVASFKAL